MDRETIAGVTLLALLFLVSVGAPIYWLLQRRRRRQVERTGDLVLAQVLRSRSIWRKDGSPDFRLLLSVPEPGGAKRETKLNFSSGGMALPREGSLLWVVVDPQNRSRVYVADRDAFERGSRQEGGE